jgi:hypothetical protein
VWDRSKRFQHTFEEMIRKQQRIASREDDIPHFCVLAKVLNGSVQLAFLEKAGLSHQSLPGTKPTIDRTLIRHHEQHPVGIPVNEMRHRAHEIFFKGILVGRNVVQLCGIGDNLFPDCVILRFDCLKYRRGDPHGVRADDRFNLFLIEAEPFGQVLGLHDALSQDLSPVFHESSFVVQLIRQEGCSSSWPKTSGVVRACD